MAVTTGHTIDAVNRIPTGIPSLDLILGGGIPENRVIEIFGPPGSCKSILAMLIVASTQSISPELRCAWLAIEPFDPIWARKFGVDTGKLLVLRPTYAEEVVQISEALIAADDCGLVVLDSFAARVSKQDTDNSKSDSGSLARVGKTLFNKVKAGQRKAADEGRATTFVFTNQIRYKGVPGELGTPGGFAPKQSAAIRLRLYANDIFDKTVHSGLPARKAIRVVIEKHEISVAALECNFEIAMVKHAGLEIGQVKDNWKVLSSQFSE
jgi:recombination protein RecA